MDAGTLVLYCRKLSGEAPECFTSTRKEVVHMQSLQFDRIRDTEEKEAVAVRECESESESERDGLSLQRAGKTVYETNGMIATEYWPHRAA